MDDNGNENARPGDESGRAQGSATEMKSTKAFDSNDAASSDARKPSFKSETRAIITAGFTLVPLHAWNAVETDQDGKTVHKGKAPLHGKWQEKAYDAATVVATAEKASLNVGVRISGSDLLVVDVDPRNFKGVDSYENLKRDFKIEESDFPCVHTGGGGVHLYMRRPVGMHFAQALDDYPGIDFKTSGQVVAPGSLHPVTGLPYVGKNLDLLALELPAPAALLDRLDKSKGRNKPSDGASRVGEIGPAQLAANLAQLDVESFADYNAWLEVMMASHAATAGAGLEEFVQWSTGFTGEAASPEVIRDKWDGFSLDGNGITSRTLYGLVEKAGGTPVDRMEACEDFEVWDQPIEKNGRWKFLTIEELQAMPPPRWLVQGVLLEDSIAAIFGAPESFKSFLAVDWAMSIAANRSWHGRTVLPGGVLYIAAEGARGLAKRVRAWKAEHHHADDVPFHLMRNELNLTKESEARAFAKSVVDELEPLSLIVIDTLNQTATGADENSAQDMGRYIASMKLLRDMTGATVVVVHHSGKDRDKGLRGSSALLGGFDTTVEVVRPDPACMGIVVRVQKQKDEERDPQMRFTLEKMDESLVLRPTMMAEAANDFRADYDPIRELARQMSDERGGRMPLKLLVDAVIKQYGKADRSARRSIEKAIPLGREFALPSLDGTPVWRERTDNNPNGEMQVFSLVSH